MCVLETLAGTGISLGCIALFREVANQQGRLAAFFSANAFAVYVIHAPILIVITRLMGGWHGLPLLKFEVATVLAILVSFAAAAGIFRRAPLLKKIL
jgi:hypothetical protein